MDNNDVETVPIEDLEFSRKQLLQSRTRLANLKRSNYSGDDLSPHEITTDDMNKFSFKLVPQVIISACQVCVELSAKSIFKTVGVKPIESHDISLSHERVEGVLNRIPSEMENPDDVSRVIFLTQFWERFYEMAKYGVPEHNVSSSDIMTESDSIRAVHDAEFCIDTAETVHDLQMEAQGYDTGDLDLFS